MQTSNVDWAFGKVLWVRSLDARVATASRFRCSDFFDLGFDLGRLDCSRRDRELCHGFLFCHGTIGLVDVDG